MLRHLPAGKRSGQGLRGGVAANVSPSPAASAGQAMQRKPMCVVALSWDCDDRAAGR
jgi:hypothetical protein